ncbi:MAG TPA: DnaJ domain-containing protein [Candidatus Limnocylindrales bacterium]|nr:DnaJ domain-containing protein [Candidatus Limnocylindrales bacterium]
MAKREPHVVLSVDPAATPAQIKAAWRKLARRHHPDLTGDDPEASRIATRQMAEINEAYAVMTRADYRPDRASAARGGGAGATFDDEGPRRRGGPPKPRPTRPVTGRVDMSHTVRPRNAPLRPANSAGGAEPTLRGQPPIRWTTEQREPPRASHPSGPLERGRVRNFRPPPLPPVHAARDHELTFGKFRGHTLGEVAAFEPSYVDWLARTITRDPDLVAAARSVKADLDQRGVVRRPHHIGENERRAQARDAG